ncbi:MAG: excinuclease ABC subunit UvrC [Alphaproteobacteria bacterium]|nr:excinuclease ABC subunit UvrC [Alphaproteobacteria bacterium]
MTDDTRLSSPLDPPSVEPGEGEQTSARRLTGANLARGVAVIQAVVDTLPASPGVYRMLAGDGSALYVGKARSLKARVVNYTRVQALPNRLKRMVAETITMEIVTTHTEVEALLLEANLIKTLEPRYNVLLRDDKSFPHILLTGDHAFARITKHRGARNRPGDYYGPFASANAVNKTIVALQRAFLLRNCSDQIFSSRTRPCLQYQIKRCAAPCVGRISEDEYGALVADARRFLAGRSRDVQDRLVSQMQEAAEHLEFERAARLRDRIRALTFVQTHQEVNVDFVEDADVIAIHQAGGSSSVQVFFFRGGSNYGTRCYAPRHDRDLGPAAVLASFLGQFYDGKQIPPLILLSEAPDELELLGEALSLRAGRKVSLVVPQRGTKRSLVENALTNAREAHGRRLAEASAQRTLLEGLAERLGLEDTPERVEVYDNSHIQGTNAVGAMIVAGPEGLMKGQYRTFKIRNTAVAGDDYGMMREVLTRRLSRLMEEDPDGEKGTKPDLLLIDGGQGQLGVAVEVLKSLDITDLPVAAIAKGPDRDAGRERFFLPDREPFQLPPNDPVLYFLQRLRDEAHRFAIGTHRARRTKALGRSELDEIAGIGSARKKALLQHFGSARAVARAGLEDLAAVPGINRTVAQKIYDHFHPGG